MYCKLALFSCFLFLTTSTFSQAFIDESFDDWSSVSSSYVDQLGDGGSSGIDFTDVKISNDENNLFIYFDLQKEINIQASNKVTLYIDIDNNPSTGVLKNGIGAEVVYTLGDRKGLYYAPTFTTSLWHDDIALVTAPTVTSSKFELSLSRKITYGSAVNTSIMANNIKILLSDESIGGDKIPNVNLNGGLAYSFDNNLKSNLKPFSITKVNSNDLRIMSYNVLRDNLFEGFTQNAYRRIFSATKPDIIGFCEIYDHSSEVTADLMESFMPSTNVQKWYHSESVPDIRVVSRFPIIDRRSINGNGAFLIDLGAELLVFIVAHLPCCENETDRQQEVDNIMSFVRNIRYGTSPFQTPQNTPIVIVGDMNLVGLRAQQQTLITGDIVNNSSYGPDFDPDWDDTSLEDCKPATTNLPSTFTWNNPSGSYSAGRLDYVLYTGSILSVANSFSLYTPALTTDQLTSSGLQVSDVPIASDHLPVVCDFASKISSTTNQLLSTEIATSIVQNGQLHLAFSEAIQGTKRISFVDIAGRVLYQEVVNTGIQSTTISLDVLAFHGLYIVHVETDQGIYNTKIIH